MVRSTCFAELFNLMIPLSRAHVTSMMKLSTASLWPESRVFNNLSYQADWFER